MQRSSILNINSPHEFAVGCSANIMIITTGCMILEMVVTAMPSIYVDFVSCRVKQGNRSYMLITLLKHEH